MKLLKISKSKIFIIIFFICIIFISVLSFSENSNKTIYYEDSLSLEKDNIHLFYNQLSDDDKAVYLLFVDLIENKDIEDYEKTLCVKTDTYNELTMDHFWNIYYTVCYDHPEYFFLLTGDSPRISAYTSENEGFEQLRFSLTPAPAGENDMIAELEKAADVFLEDIDLSLSEQDIALLIHDKLIDLVSYDHELYTKDMGSTYCDLSSTAYGALVHNSSGAANTALCGGYALAYEYLCQQAGICCGYVTGMADPNIGDDDDPAFHAWNLLKLNGVYCETDATWDDFDVTEKTSDEKLIKLITDDRDTYYAVTHHYYNLSTSKMEHLAQKETTTFIIEGYSPYNPRSDSSHKRGTYSLGVTDGISMYLNSLLPIAEGFNTAS